MKRALLAILAMLFLAVPAMADWSGSNPVSTIVYANGAHWEFYELETYAGSGSPLRLFEPPGTTNPDGSPDTSTWAHNNTSPIEALPGTYVPSPSGTADGESFDIEGLFWDYDADTNTLDAWVVTSIDPDGNTYAGYDYHLGDVFLDTDNDGAYEYALLSFGTAPGLSSDHDVANTVAVSDSWTGTGRDAGDIVDLGTSYDDYRINGPRSYDGLSSAELDVIDQAGPWAVEGTTGSFTLEDDGTLEYQYVTGSVVDDLDNDPLASGQGTYIYHWEVTVDLDDAIDYLSIPGAFHVTVQCGNDAGDNGGGPGGGGDIPAPGALILGILGAGLVGLRKRMRS